MTRALPAALVALALGGCATHYSPSSPGGCIALGVSVPELGAMQKSAFQFAPGWAVTTRHGGETQLYTKTYPAKGYDIAFYRREGRPAPLAQAHVGERVELSGNLATILDFFGIAGLPTCRTIPGRVVGFIHHSQDWIGIKRPITLMVVRTEYSDEPKATGGYDYDVRLGGFSGSPVKDDEGRNVGMTVAEFLHGHPASVYGVKIERGDLVVYPAQTIERAYQQSVEVKEAKR